MLYKHGKWSSYYRSIESIDIFIVVDPSFDRYIWRHRVFTCIYTFVTFTWWEIVLLHQLIVQSTFPLVIVLQGFIWTHDRHDFQLPTFDVALQLAQFSKYMNNNNNNSNNNRDDFFGLLHSLQLFELSTWLPWIYLYINDRLVRGTVLLIWCHIRSLSRWTPTMVN